MKFTICFTNPFGALLHNKTKTADFKIRNLIQLGWSLNPKTWAEFVHLFFFPFFFIKSNYASHSGECQLIRYKWYSRRAHLAKWDRASLDHSPHISHSHFQIPKLHLLFLFFKSKYSKQKERRQVIVHKSRKRRGRTLTRKKKWHQPNWKCTFV